MLLRSLLFLASLEITQVLTCTEFVVNSKDGSTVVGRTFEFEKCFKYLTTIVSLPKNSPLEGDELEMIPGCTDNARLKWKSKYKSLYVVVDFLKFKTWVDGVNEAGLSIGALYLPGFASYPSEIPNEKCLNSISQVHLLKFMLSNYGTVKEVKAAIENGSFPFVWGRLVKYLPLHWNIVDQSGDSIVLEYTDKGISVFDDEVGVMTNSPTYDWQITNLNNYVNLQRQDFGSKEFNRDPEKEHTHTLKPFGLGSGLLGVPGDFTPPSRFVRTAALLRLAEHTLTAEEGVLKAWHVINSVDIPKGINDDKTCWTVVKDLKHKTMYYRDYDYISLRKVELNKTPDDKEVRIKLFGEFQDAVKDMTYELKEANEKSEL